MQVLGGGDNRAVSGGKVNCFQDLVEGKDDPLENGHCPI